MFKDLTETFRLEIPNVELVNVEALERTRLRTSIRGCETPAGSSSSAIPRDDKHDERNQRHCLKTPVESHPFDQGAAQ